MLNKGLWATALDWFQQAAPWVYAALAAVVLSLARQVYDGGSTLKRSLCEAAMCGLIALVIVSGLDSFGVPSSAATFVGGAVGFLGVERVRRAAENWFGTPPIR